MRPPVGLQLDQIATRVGDHRLGLLALGALMVTIAGVGIFFINLFWSLAAGKQAPNNPWGEGATTLEWTLSSPPPFHQFETLPKID